MKKNSYPHKHLTKQTPEYFSRPKERYLNRELSWLAFNWRVMEEAQNPAHPLLERVRFLSISASNLDEFFMVRVAGLNDQLHWENADRSMDGLLPSEQLKLILQEAGELMQDQQACWQDLKQLLKEQDIQVLSAKEMGKRDIQWLRSYFRDNLFPALTPLAIDPAHPFPFLPNKSLTSVYSLVHSKRNDSMTALLPLPPKLPRFVKLPGKEARFVTLEDVINLNLDELFPGYHLQDTGTFRVLRDSDLDISDEAEDLVRDFEKAVKERKRGHVIRLKVSSSMPPYLRDFIAKQLHVSADYVIEIDGFLGLAHIEELLNLELPELKFDAYSPRYPERIIDYNGDCFAAIRAKDIVIHHPYESFDVVVQFLRQAAQDDTVISIKQTLYRTSNDSPIVKALIEAAESGKSVTAVVELRARFDEEANIRWARDLERAGAQVVYGFVDYKTHAKVSLVTRIVEGELQNYVHFGTGNYHPVTAKIYTDLSFFTCDSALCRDAAMLFNYLTGYAPPDSFNKLAVSPLNMRQQLIKRIYHEIANAQAGKPAGIWAKMNALVDPELIDALYYASQQGVEIELIVRGICCLRPGIKGWSERIRVRSIIGRFLEHSRIFCFANGHEMPSPKAHVFISSADWMHRNMDRRVEFMVPVENATVHAQILDQIMMATLLDNQQSWEMQADGRYQRIVPESGEGQDALAFASHTYFMRNPSLSGRGKALRQNTHSAPNLSRLKPRLVPANPTSDDEEDAHDDTRQGGAA